MAADDPTISTVYATHPKILIIVPTLMSLLNEDFVILLTSHLHFVK